MALGIYPRPLLTLNREYPRYILSILRIKLGQILKPCEPEKPFSPNPLVLSSVLVPLRSVRPSYEYDTPPTDTYMIVSKKIMWMAWDRYRRTRRDDHIDVEFITGMPTMFSVPKYSEALNKLREQRGIGALFKHNLTSIDPARRVASFKTADGVTAEKEYTLLHVTPPMGPPDFIKSSPLADGAGWVDVDQGTLQHKKFSNVFSLGDASSLPTSKTAAAITAQAPVLTHNLVSLLNTGKIGKAVYDGYTSCPVRTPCSYIWDAQCSY
jgi:eukaryotic sulfide quinone oxidoreductase